MCVCVGGMAREKLAIGWRRLGCLDALVEICEQFDVLLVFVRVVGDGDFRFTGIFLLERWEAGRRQLFPLCFAVIDFT